MTCEYARLEKQFPELHGFVLLDPARLDAFCESRAEGADLLTRFTQTDDGDRICQEGIAIPMTGIDAGDYSISIRDSLSPGPEGPPRVLSQGWILGTETGEVVFSGLGYLACWDPDHPRHARIRIPAGWYGVDIRGYVLGEGGVGEEWLYDLALTRSRQKPPFTADLTASFGLLP